MAEEQKNQEGSVGEREEVYMEGMTMLDFDMLCASVALQTQGFSSEKRMRTEEGDDYGGDESGGVQRMWEGNVLDCFEDRRIALETAYCPCSTFGKNMGRAGFGPCFVQGTIYFALAMAVLFNFIAFVITRRHCFLYLAIGFVISLGLYLGFFRTQIRKQFNIRGRDSGIDDCMNHLLCPCCTLCQESRTLELNNVQDGVWRGRGDAICIGSCGDGSKAFVELRQSPLIPTKSPALLSMERSMNSSNDHSWGVGCSHSEPLVSQAQ